MASSPARVARQMSHHLVRTGRETMAHGVASIAIEDAAFSMGVSVRAILGLGRTPKVSRARCLAWWLMRETSGLTLQKLGEATGFDQSSVWYGIRRFEAELQVGERWAIEALNRLGNARKRAA